MISSPSRRRVVVTGIGLICPLGSSKEALWEALEAGRSGVGPLESVPTSPLPMTFAAEARQFSGKIDDFGPLEAEQKKAIRKALKVMCREIQMGVAAAQLSLTDAGLTASKLDPDRSGTVFGADYMLTVPEEFNAGIDRCKNEAGRFEFGRWPREGMAQLNPLWLLKYLPNMPASHFAIFNDMRGPNNSITQREAAANLAIGEAFRTIERGHADLMVAGATGTRVHPMKTIHALQWESLAPETPDPARAARPFDLNRTGMVLGEGAAAIVLEDQAAAEKRGAKILGEVIGFGSSAVIDRRGVGHRGQAVANALRSALRDAGLEPDQVGHIHAHGLSSKSADREEAQAIRAVFGAAADRVPVTAAKSYFGNLGAAGGLVELAASLLALQHERLFPVLNYETPDPECPLNVARPGAAARPGDCVLNVSFTPQGQASAVIVRR
ncbi:MAG: beta-ketoacyl-[acyl-carrier-protein] synthase family protein [Pirellulales bacterium]